MPDDYYVSQYSGEEIDAMLASAGEGTVRYDAAQPLTDEQKQQARANIAAAPDGFGLGSVKPSKTYESTNGDNITETGWYVIIPEVAGFDIGYSLVRQENYSANYAVQTLYLFKDTTGFGKNCVLRRVKESNTWYPWEWVNPPMRLGVEYRTTERYLGKPVYVKLIDCGNLPDGTTKEVAHGITNLGFIVGAQAIASDSSSGFNGRAYLPVIYNGSLTDRWTNYLAGVDTNNIRIFCGGGLAGCPVYVTFKYTKSTD